MNTCSKCGKEFSEPPATSRRDDSQICPLCGSKEAIEDAFNAGAMTKEDADGIIKKLEQLDKQ